MIKKFFSSIIFLMFFVQLCAVHDFTINGATSATVTVTDSIHLEFDFESAGNSADFDLNISLLGQAIPIFSGNYMIFQDGGMLDETDIDGHFSGGFNNFIQLPEGAVLEIALTDEEITDVVELEFIQLNTDFSISGNVLQEGEWIDLPVMGGLVWTLYNGSAELIIELLENFELEAFLQFIESDHYILSDLTGFLGDYQIMIPEDIDDVSCAVGVYSLLDLEGGFVPPDNQDVTVNGHLTDIDFMYFLPDGEFYGVVTDDSGNPVADAGFMLENPNSVMPYIFASDSLGNFSISLLDGTYSYSVAAIGFDVVSDSVTIDGADVYREIVLTETGGIGGTFYGYVYDDSGEPIVNAEIMVIPIEPAGNPVNQYSMGDGSFSFVLQNGTYSFMATHAYYEGLTGEFEIIDSDVYMEMTMYPSSDVDENIAVIKNVSCYPNPFNPKTMISFYLQQDMLIQLKIFNARGQLVKTLNNGLLNSGEHQFFWNGSSDNGSTTSSGLYYYMLTGYQIKKSGKIVLLK